MAGLIFHPFKYLKRYMPKSLFGRVSLILLAPLVLVMLTTTFVFIDRHWENSTQKYAENIAGDVAALVEIRRTGRWPADKIADFAKDYFNFHLTFNSNNTKTLTYLTPMRSLGLNFLTDAFHKVLSVPFHATISKNTIEVKIILDHEVMNISMSRKRLLSKTALTFLMWQLGTPILFFIIAAIFMRNQIRPIRRLAYTADRFGKGREVKKFKPEGAFEIRKAGIAFNLMRKRFERQITQRTEMLAGVSHDLRTPLTRMELQFAMMTESPEIKGLKADVKEMTKMIESYLSFARGEDGEKAKITNLKMLLESIIGSLTSDASLVHLSCPHSLRLEVKVQALKRGLTNLIENSLRYAPHTWIRVEKTSHDIRIYIEDDGPGIPKDKREDVFKPFFRLEQSRNTNTGGVGLGLSIARDAIQQHGGKITLKESSRGGLCIVIHLPI